MPPFRRVAIYLAILLAVLVLGWLLAVAGLSLCSPPPLPGDEWWSWRQRLFEALGIVGQGVPGYCYVPSRAGIVMQRLASETFMFLLAVALVMLLLETAGRALRRLWFQRRGGHAILAGNAEEIATFAAEQRAVSQVCFVTFSREEERSLAAEFPFAEMVRAWRRRGLAAPLRRAGASKARLIAAASDRDLENIGLVEETLALMPPGGGRAAQLVLRIEQPTVRVLRSYPVRQAADARGVPLSVISLDLLQVREGLALAMPGRYRAVGAVRHHVAICGSGPLVQAIAFRTARQAYGLEREKPLLSILRTGRSDFTAGAYERLQAAEMAVTTASAAVDPDDIHALEAAIASVALADAPLAAVHCVGETPDEAEALADRWERTLLRLKIPVPPIVAYLQHESALGSTGMIRIARSPGLSEAVRSATLVDRRARSLHEAYAAAQKAAKGDGFGALPGEAPWDLLPETMQEDNRNAADNLEYKLALIGFRAVGGTGKGASIGKRDTERLAAAEHGRWLAAKSLDGWKFGTRRDNEARLHPDMVHSYAELSEPAKQKDRDVIDEIPALLRLGGERLQQEKRFLCAIGAAGRFADQNGALAAALRSWADHHAARFAVIVCPLDGLGPLTAAEYFQAQGLQVEIAADATMFGRLAGLGRDAMARGAAVVRRAYRISVVSDREARDAVQDDDLPVVVDERGGVHVDRIS